MVIVNYNSGPLLRDCLSSLFAFVRVPFEVIVVDNGSADGSTGNLPDVSNIKILRPGENLGFARGCNFGARAARGLFLHFLNPDTEVGEDINEFYAHVQAAAAVRPTIFVTHVVDTQRGFESRGHLIPRLSNLWYLAVDRQQVERWYVGASLAIDHRLFENLGGWCEDHFMYAEDLDFFYRAHRAGIAIVISPAKVTHHQGGSSRATWSPTERQRRVERSGWLFARKHGLRAQYFLFKHIAVLAELRRSPREAWRELAAFWNVLFTRELPRPN